MVNSELETLKISYDALKAELDRVKQSASLANMYAKNAVDEMLDSPNKFETAALKQKLTALKDKHEELTLKHSDLAEKYVFIQCDLAALREENERLKDTPGGKRIYSALNEITKLQAQLKIAEKMADAYRQIAPAWLPDSVRDRRREVLAEWEKMKEEA